MTVETTISRAGPYAGAGTVGPFPVPFRFLENSHLRLLKTNVATGAVATLVLDTDYTVTGAGNETGAVTLAAVLPVGFTLTVLRNVPATQEADYVENDPFPAESHEMALDKLTMLVQQHGEVQARALVVPATDPVASRELPSAAARARRYLSFNDLGEPVATTFDIDAISQASQAAIDAAGRAANSEADAEAAAATAVERAEFVKHTVDGVTPTIVRFSGDGVITTFTLPSYPGAVENTLVAWSGVYQQANTYTVEGDKIIFDAAPPVGSGNVEVRIAPNVALAIGEASGISINDDGTIRSLDSYVKETRADVDELSLTVADIGSVASGAAASVDALSSTDTSKGISLVRGGQRVVNFASDVRAAISAANFSIKRMKASANVRLPLDYFLDASDTVSADDGVNVIVAADGGRYKPADLGYFDVRHAGALVDNSTDDSAALRKALTRSAKLLVTGRMYINQIVDLPASTEFVGIGRYRSAIVFGPSGGLRHYGTNEISNWSGNISFADIGLNIQDSVTATINQLDYKNIKNVSATNCVMYGLNVLMDNHHFFVHTRCHMYSTKVRSRCTVATISEAPIWDKCFMSGVEIDCLDTVEPALMSCIAFAGAYTIKTGVDRATGDNANFYMGPVLIGNILDAVSDSAVTVTKGGTSARIMNNFISAGRGASAPGMKLFNCLGMGVIGNHFEWCGNGGLYMEACEDIALSANQHLNHANGNGLVLASACQRITVVGDKFRNADLYGGSGLGNMQQAIVTPGSDLVDSVIVGCSANNMRASSAAYISGSRNIVRYNPGIPDSGGFAYTSASRPTGVDVGYTIFDSTLNKPIWMSATGWRDSSGSAV